MRKTKAFTLIEILVVATIIGLLTAAAFISYAQLSRQSRDAKRKADLEQIRAAVEMYRSNNASNAYPSFTLSCSSTGGISEGTTTYLSSIPKDPKCSTNTYYYSTSGTDYTLGAFLEASSSTCSSTYSCGGVNCNYCLGPYGQK